MKKLLNLLITFCLALAAPEASGMKRKLEENNNFTCEKKIKLEREEAFVSRIQKRIEQFYILDKDAKAKEELFGTLGWCCCDDSPRETREKLLIAQVNEILEAHPDKNKQFVHTAFASGMLFQTYLLVDTLLFLGYTDIVVNTIELSLKIKTSNDLREIIKKDYPDATFELNEFKGSESYIKAIEEKQAPKSHSFDMIDLATGIRDTKNLDETNVIEVMSKESLQTVLSVVVVHEGNFVIELDPTANEKLRALAQKILDGKNLFTSGKLDQDHIDKECDSDNYMVKTMVSDNIIAEKEFQELVSQTAVTKETIIYTLEHDTILDKKSYDQLYFKKTYAQEARDILKQPIEKTVKFPDIKLTENLAMQIVTHVSYRRKVDFKILKKSAITGYSFYSDKDARTISNFFNDIGKTLKKLNQEKLSQDEVDRILKKVNNKTV